MKPPFATFSMHLCDTDSASREELYLHAHPGLKFSKVKWKYCQQKIAGSAGGNTAGHWDLSMNRVAT